jgi:microcystin-dependent protein
MGIVNPQLPTVGGPRGDGEAAIRNALATILAEINGTLDAANVKDGSLTVNELGAALQQMLVPTGFVSYGANASAPAGWLVCDGSAVSRTTYAALFAEIGTTFGSGNGTTTFNLPDLRGRVPVGKGTHSAVDTLGDSDVLSLANRSPVHAHAVSLTTGQPSAASAGYAVTSGGASAPIVTHTHEVNGNTGVGGPAFLTLNGFIKV